MPIINKEEVNEILKKKGEIRGAAFQIWRPRKFLIGPNRIYCVGMLRVLSKLPFNSRGPRVRLLALKKLSVRLETTFLIKNMLFGGHKSASIKHLI